MRKRMRFTIPLIIAFILMSFVLINSRVTVPDALKVTDTIDYKFPEDQFRSRQNLVFTRTIMPPPFLGSSFIGFREALAIKESTGNYFSTNSLGYLGKYQFGIGTLQLIGVSNATHFLNDPVLQEQVFQFNIARNKWILRNDIERFSGKWIGGIKVTESGMLAAAHLAGPGNVIKYLRSNGRYNVADIYGTDISKYMRKFSGYDISLVSPKRNPKI